MRLSFQLHSLVTSLGSLLQGGDLTNQFFVLLARRQLGRRRRRRRCSFAQYSFESLATLFSDQHGSALCFPANDGGFEETQVERDGRHGVVVTRDWVSHQSG